MRRIWTRLPDRRPIQPNGSAGQDSNGPCSCLPGHRECSAAGPHVAPLRGDPFWLPTNPRWLRDRLLGELSGLQSDDEAASWAHRSLPAKNTLTVADAQLVEAASAKDSQLWGISSPGSFRRSFKTRLRQNRPDQSGCRQAPTAYSKEPGIRRGRVAAKTIRLRDKDPPQIRLLPALPGVRPFAGRCPPSALCPASGARPQGQ